MSSPKNAQNTFVDVVLPLALPRPYTYSLTSKHLPEAEIGKRVVVQLGQRKLYTGIVVKIHTNQPEYQTKEIVDFLDLEPIVYQNQLNFWKWISDYYMCFLGDVMNAAVPSSLKVESETKIIANKKQSFDWNQLSDQEFLIMEALENRSDLTIVEAGKILALHNPMRIVKTLLEKELLLLEEEVSENAQAKTHPVIFIPQKHSEDELNRIFESLSRSPKQSALLLAYFQLNIKYKDGRVPERKLLGTASATKQSLKGLIEKQILYRDEQLAPAEENFNIGNIALSKAQKSALQQIKESFAAKTPVLLHGVTSSGKTEIYITLIQKALQKHKRALYLVPEISLTTQLINRLQKHFGESAVVYHSRISQRERLAVYNRLLTEDKPIVLLGARSALLLPLNDLGIVIIDEEHDASFKQQDPAPRYQARDAALILAQLQDCPILMGSATPSAESYNNALEGKYTLVALTERFGGVNMPEIEVVDIRKETLWKTMRGHYSPQLFAEIEEALQTEKRVILFQNRRGYTPVVQCTSCGHTHECVNCDITLTYHKFAHKLKCHYCGYSVNPPSTCPQCHSTELKEVGFGTEKLEEEIQTLLPNATIARMDLDSTRKKNAFNKLIQRFEDGEIDILIGTQMVTKGLDFDDVKLVGILNADSMLHYPDFRAQERAFQLMEQVAGRAGRRSDRGRVTIQSFKPDHRIINHVLKHDYKNMMAEQLLERKIFKYPPFTRLIHIDLRHRDYQVLDAVSSYFASELRQQFKEMVLGPEYPANKRLKGIYHKSILLKLDRSVSVAKVKQFIWQLHQHTLQHAAFKSVKIVFDVDPY